MSQQQTKEELKKLILKNWDIVEEIHEDRCTKLIRLQQCHRCKEVYDSEPSYCLLTMCSWCEIGNVCDNCCIEVYYSKTQSYGEGFCSDDCMGKYMEDQEIGQCNKI